MAETPTVLVTGSTSGIGYATARGLVARGDDVVVSGRSRETVDDAVRRLDPSGAVGSSGLRVRGVAADLVAEGGAETLVEEIGQERDHLDGLVLCHGGDQAPEIFAGSHPGGFTRAAEMMFLTNARVLHAALPLLRQCPAGARVVLVTSDAGRFPTTGEAMIGAFAAANLMFVRTLARELARDRVRVNAVPVTITADTLTYDRVMSASNFSRRLFEKAEAQMPYGAVTPDDVAATILHLLSDAGRMITGQVVGVTGGLAT